MMHSVHRLLASRVVINYGFAFRPCAASANYGAVSGREYETQDCLGRLRDYVNKVLARRVCEGADEISRYVVKKYPGVDYFSPCSYSRQPFIMPRNAQPLLLSIQIYMNPVTL